MDQPASRLEANALKAVIIPIVGLLGGLLAGVAWTVFYRLTDIDAILVPVKGALVGSFLGMGAAFAVATGPRRNLTTTRGLAWLVGIVAILLFFWSSIP